MHADPADTGDLCQRLAAEDWSVREVHEEIAALQDVKGTDYDVAVLHYPVSDVVDMDLAHILREVAASAYLPVVVVAAAHVDPQERIRFLDSGADDIVTHATGTDEMVARINSLLRIKRLHDKLADSRAALQESLARERKLMEKLRKDNEHLQQLATTDPLTHTQNLRSFQNIMEHEFRIAKRYNQPLSMLMLDVDHFKVVNDTYGHPSGDYVLKELAVIYQEVIRESDVVARTGGEEFSVLLPKATLADALRFAERIRSEACRRKFTVFGQDIHVTVSVGVACFPVDVEVGASGMLVYFADQALYAAKETGRDRVVAFHDLPARTRHRLRRQYEQPEFAADHTPIDQIIV